ncbi:MAG: class I SAM-dependent methyltransferase [Opitutae bacterium]|nr:class I SAM-dependent methyltransferase [Opitutae bacterium]
MDAGCGLGYKAAWFARLAPESLVVAMDFSDAIYSASERYQDHANIIFVKGDIANTGLRDGVIDMVNCDQVLHHTESPPRTLHEFYRITKSDGLLNTYVYAKKALPRELLDEHFREKSKKMSHDEIWALSKQLTELGKRLTDLDLKVDVPEIPALGIKAGEQEIQRFIYWNFLKCFWNEELGRETSVSTNFDWYSPSNAFRYDREEFIGMCENAGWANDFLHSEEACWSGRFVKGTRKDDS